MLAHMCGWIFWWLIDGSIDKYRHIAIHIIVCIILYYSIMYYLWASVVAQGRIHLQWGRPEFNPWVWKIPWRRAWQPIPVFLPGESHAQRSLAVYSPWGHKEFDTTEQLSTHATILNLHVFSPVISFCIYWNTCIYTEDTAKSMHNCIIKKSCKLVRIRYNNREINCINWYSDIQYILENKWTM